MRSKTLVKICGLTSPEDALAAVAAGADAVGVVLAEGGPRHVTVERAAEVLAPVPPSVMRVGVFVDPSREEVDSAVATLGLKVVQLHGSESPEFCARTFEMVAKAFRVDETFSPAALAPYRDAVVAVLLDGALPRIPGGTGRTFDWELARYLDVPALGLAGGLTPENVADAMRLVRPDAVDVSSGVESAPGVKDHDRMRAFVRAVREADEEKTR